MFGKLRPVTALEVLWEDGALIVRTPARAFRRRGTLDTTVAPIVAGLLVPVLLSIGEPADPVVWLLLAVIGVAGLGSTLTGIYFLTFAQRLSRRSTRVFRREQAQGGEARVLLTGRAGAVNLALPPGSRATALTAWFPATKRLVVQDPSGQVLCVVSPRAPDYYREEWERALSEINRLLAGQDLPERAGLVASSVVAAPYAPLVAESTPGERSLAMLCYLPVHGVFALASLGCLVASRSRYVRSAAKQSLLQLGFSLVLLGLVLALGAVPRALVQSERVQAGVALSLTILLALFAVWNLTVRIYACVRFYQGRPWVMPWLRPIAQRWFR